MFGLTLPELVKGITGACLLAYRKRTVSAPLRVRVMPSMTAERKALTYLKAFEAEGRVVKRLAIEGKRIELELETMPEDLSKFDRVDMRYGKAGAS